ncbi:hypothetical protein QTG54_002135, partial [Skeletonema marinoi]
MNLRDYYESVMSMTTLEEGEGVISICRLVVIFFLTFYTMYYFIDCVEKVYVNANANNPLRFTVGDRVRCCPPGGEWTQWKEGTIAVVSFDDGKYPYYVQCDDGSQLKIPKDHDLCIQKMHEQFVAVLGPDGKPLNQIPDLPAKDPAAELRQEALFKESPPEEDCPICNIRFPMKNETCTLACCGKSMCIGCMVQNRDSCLFCEEDLQQFNSNAKGILKRLLHRIHHSSDDQDKIQALSMLASSYDTGAGGIGVRRDSKKAHQLWMEAVELGGSKDAHYNLSQSYSKYYKERGVEKDDKKELYHLEEAAMLGDAAARCELGKYEGERGNWDRAKKHWMLSAAAGCKGCMERIKRGKKKGAVSNDEYKKTLRAHRKSLNLTRSAQRDAARKRLNLKV